MKIEKISIFNLTDAPEDGYLVVPVYVSGTTYREKIEHKKKCASVYTGKSGHLTSLEEAKQFAKDFFKPDGVDYPIEVSSMLYQQYEEMELAFRPDTE